MSSTITQERAKLKAIGRTTGTTSGLRSREQAGFRFNYSDNTGSRAVTEPARLVFIHITITNPGSYSSDDAHARAVESIGISRFPSTGVSYNRLIMQSGKAYEGQPIGRQGAHTVNNKNITTCAEPGCPSRGTSIPSAATNLNDVVRAYAICQNVGDTVPDAELHALAKAIAADILAGFITRDFRLHGHRCVAYKDCPGAKMWALLATLKSLIAHYVSTGFLGTEPVPEPTPTPVPEDDADMFITVYGSTQYRMFIDRRVIALSEPTYNALKDGGVPVRQLSNAAVDALASICANYLTVDTTPTPGTEDAYLEGILEAVSGLRTDVDALKAAVEALAAPKAPTP